MDRGNNHGGMGGCASRAASHQDEVRPMSERHPILYSHVIPAIVAIFGIGPLAYLALDRAPPYERVRGFIYPSNAKAGERVAIHWDGDRKRSCFGVVNRTIVDSHGVVYAFEAVAAVYADVKPGMQLAREFSLPAQISPGPAVYRAITRYVCNPVQNFWPIFVQGPDVHFNIAE